MFRLSWNSVLARKVRLVMSGLAIVLGVAFITGSLTFGDMISKVYNGLLKGTVADINVRALGQGENTSQVIYREITAAQVAKMREIAGVASVHGVILVTDAYPFSKTHKIIGGGGAPAMGMNWFDAPAAGGSQGMVIKSGRAPTADNEVAVDPSVLEKGGYRLGDTLEFATTASAQETASATIVGTAVWGATNSTGGATYVLMPTKRAQQLYMQGKDAFVAAWVSVLPGQDVGQVLNGVRQVTPAGFEAVDAAEAGRAGAQQISAGLSFIKTLLLAFAAIALVVGSFLIVNTFSILVAQRSREFALLHALGASKRQVRQVVLVEAMIIGLLGSLVGMAAGLGVTKLISRLFSSIGLELSGTLPTLAPRTVVVSLVVGIGVTLIAAYRPARKAGAVPPVVAMRMDAMTGERALGRRLFMGLALAVIGAAGMVASSFVSIANRASLTGLGALVVFIGVTTASPVFGRPMIWLMGRIYRRVFGAIGQLAELNAVRNPRRTAATASALMIGLTLVTFLATLGSTMKTSTAQLVRSNMRADYVAQNVNGAPFSPAVGDAMVKIHGVASVARMRYAKAKVGGEDQNVTVMDASSFNKIVAQEISSGSLAAYSGNSLIVDQETANKHSWKAGDSLSTDIAGQHLKLTVAATYTTPQNGHRGVFIPLTVAAAAGVPQVDYLLGVARTPASDPGTVRAELEKVVASMPLVTVYSPEEYAKQQSAYIDTLLNLLYALLSLAIIVAVLGIINTLALSVTERTREIGLARAIGVTQGQQSLMIALESIAIALLGSVLGIAMGLIFATAIIRGLADQGLGRPVVAWGQLGLFVVISIMVGVLAAAWPALRASRLSVLAAITTE